MSRSLHEASMPKKHELWMARFGCVYKDSEEKEMHFKIFQTNVEFIESFNGAGSRSYKLSVNEFADQTNEEFIASRNGYKRSSPRKSLATSSFRYQNVTTVPSSIDWRKKGAVTPVKDQGNVLVDCDTSGVDQGCEGGLMDDAFTFIENNHGLATEANYPYKGIDGTCSTKKAAAKINGYEDVPANSEKALLKAVANQPVSVAIDASGSDFQFYSSGVFTGECGTSLDHGVTAVGYGTSADGTKYWLVKNSWGTEWGVDGYIMMQRNVDASEGLCGIAMEASYPIA
ncbi:hypothetical protein HHK36_023556 [Tetracentron sinense]|uniref:Uncharacterized protein n=1 Tax=Tetracentron sinense TaxID=13715 RepID=A0A834YLL4_TETSI|nr:hypothetical protein HHK36_023556 [Tetracentron sinense]